MTHGYSGIVITPVHHRRNKGQVGKESCQLRAHPPFFTSSSAYACSLCASKRKSSLRTGLSPLPSRIQDLASVTLRFPHLTSIPDESLVEEARLELAVEATPFPHPSPRQMRRKELPDAGVVSTDFTTPLQEIHLINPVREIARWPIAPTAWVDKQSPSLGSSLKEQIYFLTEHLLSVDFIRRCHQIIDPEDVMT